MTAPASLLPELDQVLQHGSPERRALALSRITTLFLDYAPRFSEAQIAVFDDVLLALAEQIEARARAELATRIAPVDHSPVKTVRNLAHDDDIAVAGPVLRQSRLDEPDLKFIAETKSQAHLLALSERSTISEPVSAVLVQRGDRDVAHNVAANPGAQLSTQAFVTLVTRAQGDDKLAESIGTRTDIPPRLFRELLMKATGVVQKRLLNSARPETQEEIRSILERVSGEVAAKASPRNYTAALETVSAMQEQGTLNEAALAAFAGAGKYEETIAALAAMCNVPVEVVDRLLAGDRPDPVLILGRSSGFNWDTVSAIIHARPGGQGTSTQGIESARENFERLTEPTAQRVVRFWQLRPGA